MQKLKLTTVIVLGSSLLSFGPPNCNLFEGDCNKACTLAENAIQYPQGSKPSQQLFDQSIENCPTFAYSYYEKAVPFAKRGAMDEWKILIDKAVELEPVEYLGQRAWYHFFFTHNYEKAIEDINTLQDFYKDGDIGETGDALYHLNIMKGLCLKGLGKHQEAITCMEEQMAKPDHYLGMYDYLHLGVLYLETGNYTKAETCFNKQIEHYEISEAYYYRALLIKQFEKVKSDTVSDLKRALTLYKQHEKMHNSYRQLIDEIYQQDIIDELVKWNHPITK